MNSIINFKNFNLLLLFFLPIGIILGQFELNLTIFLITSLFLIDFFVNKKKALFIKIKFFYVSYYFLFLFFLIQFFFLIKI